MATEAQEGSAMKQTCIICDRCRSRIYGVGYSTAWSKARRRGWTHPNDDHRRHLCPECSAEEVKTQTNNSNNLSS